jgi:hypothetical protein
MEMEMFCPFGSRYYWLLLAALLLGRSMDFLSTWMATPTLALEANPLAKRLGWRWGTVVNVLVCLGFACWPLPAIMIATTSVLVAGRNFQSAWLSRSMGETHYRCWIAERVAQSNRAVFVFCFVAQALLMAGLGAVIIWWRDDRWVVLAIGFGLITYSAAVLAFSLLAAWRLWRSPA